MAGFEPQPLALNASLKPFFYSISYGSLHLFSVVYAAKQLKKQQHD